MIDGRSIYTPIFSGTFWDMQDLVLAEIDRIEVILGPGAALWGANAVNGIINIITRNTAPDNFGGTLNLHYGNSRNHKLSPSLMLNGRKNNINWQLQSGYNWHQQDQFTDIKQTFTTFTPSVIFTNKSLSDASDQHYLPYYRTPATVPKLECSEKLFSLCQHALIREGRCPLERGATNSVIHLWLVQEARNAGLERRNIIWLY